MKSPLSAPTSQTSNTVFYEPLQFHYNNFFESPTKSCMAQINIPSLTLPTHIEPSPSQQNQPQKHPKEKIHISLDESFRMKGSKNRSKRRKNGFEVSLWKLNENIAYMEFLRANESLFTASKVERKTMKINMLMSKYIKTRSPAQCRSHHQKMVKHHGEIAGIISHVELLMAKSHKQQQIQPLQAQQKDILMEMDKQIANLPQVEEKPDPILDWASWMCENEIAWEQKMNEQWMCVVDDIFGAE